MSKYHKLLKSRRWQHTRLKVFARDNWRCKRCGKAGKLECHHTTPLWKKPDQDYYDMNGLETVCRNCHILITREDRRRQRATSPYQHIINRLTK